jgi:hypothetical protein
LEDNAYQNASSQQKMKTWTNVLFNDIIMKLKHVIYWPSNPYPVKRKLLRSLQEIQPHFVEKAKA